ncbi:hypothetical protein F7731_09220 [Cytobacillus depressus]|uniref:Uncharacterized protein n=1 Tax=Cytobacillus depressus TaxID=1602942 RepID=A0A6L3VBD9_9BACI|nr:hypothetical protein F7731_09220 [Cytobacillus depressus]
MDGKHLNINHQPGFFDALELLNPRKPKSYRKIPLRKKTRLRFYYLENNIKKPIHYQFNLKKGFIAINKSAKAGDHRYLSCFLIKEGSKVSYMVNWPNEKEKVPIKKQPTILEGGKTKKVEVGIGK